MSNWIWAFPIVLTLLVVAFAWLEFVYFAGDKNDNQESNKDGL